MRHSKIPLPSGHPRDHLLKRAIGELNGTIPDAAVSSWRLLSVQTRERSTVIHMHLPSASGGRIEVFYKVMRGEFTASPEATRDRRIVEARQGLRDARRYEARLKGLIGNAPISIERTLATDVNELVSITLKVPGTHPRSARTSWATTKRKHLRLLYGELGRALRLIESSGTAYDDPLDPIAVVADLSQILDRCQRTLSHGLRERLRSFGAELAEEVHKCCPKVLAHGDVSLTNVLFDTDTVGLIDFGWVYRPPATDLAHLTVRLQSTPAAPRRWVDYLVHDLQEGYGIDPDDPPPSWQLAWLRRAVRKARDSHPRAVRVWAADRLSTLEPWRCR